MRQITTHHDGHGLNESLTVEATDEIGPGGAHHRYLVQTEAGPDRPATVAAFIQFQQGPRGEDGSIPGATELSLLAILRDRLETFQRGPYPCRENAECLISILSAMYWARTRADNRAARGVLGTYQK